MGVRRTKDSGKRDSIGRAVKVSGQQAQRASSRVYVRESHARSDFADAMQGDRIDVTEILACAEEFADICLDILPSLTEGDSR